jgi:hypothetical protein
VGALIAKCRRAVRVRAAYARPRFSSLLQHENSNVIALTMRIARVTNVPLRSGEVFSKACPREPVQSDEGGLRMDDHAR